MDPLPSEKRTAILDGAAAVFAEHGYEGASMSMITAAAGVSKGTIYQHFPGKAALFGATVARECERILAEIFQTPASTADLAGRLREICTNAVRQATSPSALAIERIVTAEATHFPELAQIFYDAGPARGIAAMAELLAGEVRAGRLRALDPLLAAEQLLMLAQTRVVMRARLGLAYDPRDVALVVDLAVEVFMRAYGV
jgi:AcrR family transcriptional regulator